MSLKNSLLPKATWDESPRAVRISYPFGGARALQALFTLMTVVVVCIGLFGAIMLYGVDPFGQVFFCVFSVFSLVVGSRAFYTPIEITQSHLVCLIYFRRREIPLGNIRWVNRLNWHGFAPLFSGWLEKETAILRVNGLFLQFLLLPNLPESLGVLSFLEQRVKEIAARE